jgi:hypothetical protein
VSDSPIDRRPNYAQLAPPTHGSPADMQLNPEVELRWYLPTWSERIRLMGWRNLLWLPTVLLILLFMSLPWMWPGVLQLLLGWWQIWIALVALPLVAAAEATRHVLRLRRDPFCIHCGYSLTGLPEGHNCPECGQPFHFGVMEDYRRDPHWFIERFRRRNDIPQRGPTIVAGTPRPRRDGT